MGSGEFAITFPVSLYSFHVNQRAWHRSPRSLARLSGCRPWSFQTGATLPAFPWGWADYFPHPKRSQDPWPGLSAWREVFSWFIHCITTLLTPACSLEIPLSPPLLSCAHTWFGRGPKGKPGSYFCGRGEDSQCVNVLLQPRRAAQLEEQSPDTGQEASWTLSGPHVGGPVSIMAPFPMPETDAHMSCMYEDVIVNH